MQRVLFVLLDFFPLLFFFLKVFESCPSNKLAKLLNNLIEPFISRDFFLPNHSIAYGTVPADEQKLRNAELAESMSTDHF